MAFFQNMVEWMMENSVRYLLVLTDKMGKQKHIISLYEWRKNDYRN